MEAGQKTVSEIDMNRLLPEIQTKKKKKMMMIERMVVGKGLVQRK